MSEIRVHIFHTGKVCVGPNLPFGGDDCGIIKASGLLSRKKNRIWLPVSAYLVEHPKGKILYDCGWSRDMSPDGVFDKKAQRRSLDSAILCRVNQGVVEKGASIDEQLSAFGIIDSDLDYVVLSHLDCDHANGLKQVRNAKNIIVSADELKSATEHAGMRYRKSWWDGTGIRGFEWNGNEGPFKRSYDIFGDGSVVLIAIPGHSAGLAAMKITGESGKFTLLYSDGGYAKRSWEEMITSGIAVDKAEQRRSLEWIREQSLNADCVESVANHDPDVAPHVITVR